MQLNLETDYALRAVIYLAKKGDSATSLEIGNAIAISRSHVQKVLRKLRNAGILSVTMGNAGGYALSKEPSDITVREILETMEEKTCINRCLEADGYCSMNNLAHCPMHQYYLGIQKVLEDTFGRTTIDDIINGRTEVRA